MGGRGGAWGEVGGRGGSGKVVAVYPADAFNATDRLFLLANILVIQFISLPLFELLQTTRQ